MQQYQVNVVNLFMYIETLADDPNIVIRFVCEQGN